MNAKVKNHEEIAALRKVVVEADERIVDLGNRAYHLRQQLEMVEAEIAQTEVDRFQALTDIDILKHSK